MKQVFRDHIYHEKDQKEKLDAKYERKKLRAMMLKPRETVLPVEVAKVVAAEGKVPARYGTDTPNQQELVQSQDYLKQIGKSSSA